MQKALTYMNLQLQHVVSDIIGVTGMRIIGPSLMANGTRKYSQPRAMHAVTRAVETIEAALVGNYQPEHLFALKQAVALYDFYQEQIRQCDHEIETDSGSVSAQKEVPTEPGQSVRVARSKPTGSTSMYGRCCIGSWASI